MSTEINAIFSCIGMILQVITHRVILMAMGIASSWFGVECFNENRFTRVVTPIYLSYFLVAALIAAMAGIQP